MPLTEEAPVLRNILNGVMRSRSGTGARGGYGGGHGGGYGGHTGGTGGGMKGMAISAIASRFMRRR